MSRHAVRDDYEDDPEEPDESDMDDNDEGDDQVDTVTCPHCRREVAAFADQCPKCVWYLAEEDTPRRTQPKWVVVTTLVLLATMLLGALCWAL